MNCIVTGASSGIGYQLVLSLCKHGTNKILAIARRQENLQQLQQECWNTFQQQIEYWAVDVNTITQELWQEKLSHWKTIHVLINNAGIIMNKSVFELEENEWASLFETNFYSVLRLIKYSIPLMNEAYKTIVNIGSIGALERISKFTKIGGYTCTKGALNTLTEVVAAELYSSGITCNALCLGAVDTPMLRSALDFIHHRKTPQEIADFIADFSLRRGHICSGQILPIYQGFRAE